MGRLTLDAVLDGKSFREPIEWADLEVLCTFPNDSVQPNISLQKVKFVNEAKDYITRMFAASRAGAMKGPYQAMPFQLFANDGTISQKIFDGYIDFKQDFVIDNPVQLSAKLVQLDSLTELDVRTRALSFGYLDSLGYFQDSDFTTVLTIVRPFDRDMQLFQLAFYEFVVIIQGRTLIKDLESDLAAGPAKFAIIIALDIAYLAILIVQLIKISKKMYDLLSPVPIKNKGITLRKGMEKICERLGYKFNTSIADIDLVYLPSRTLDENFLGIAKPPRGIPHIEDYGYNCADFIEFILGLFKARIAIINGTLELHNIASGFWTKQATYVIPPVLHEEAKWNISDLIANRVYHFDTDNMDEYTTKNYSGTNCEVITSEIVPGNPRYSLMNGFKKESFNICLGNNYVPDFDPFDFIRDILQQIIDMLNSIASKSGTMQTAVNGFVDDLTKAIQKLDKGNLLVVSGKTWSKPKLLTVLKNGRLPKNNRAVLSAAAIVNKYHLPAISFLPSNPQGQKRKYEGGQPVPFGLEDYIKLINCSYATTYAGNKSAKVESIRWKFDKDKAEINYWVNDIFTNNIKQAIIAP